MAKRSNNNSAGRRAYGEKPYDANNSFVKKMATRVTDLIPQRSWISKWFNSPGGNGLVDQDTEEQDVEEESLQPPSKRPCIRLDVTHPSETFKIQSRNRISSNTNNVNININANANSNNNINYTAHTINSNEQYEDVDETMPEFPQPIAGSSRSFAASTPTMRIPTRLTHTKSDITPLVHQHHRQQLQQNANGADDNSESSESTSGCSSLIPQTSRQDGMSNFIIYPFASNKKLNSDNNKLSFTNHLQSSKSLLFNGRDSLSSRRPSFNVSMVSNDNSPLERPSGLSSPFYSGNTTFGGANAIGNFCGARRPGQINDFQLRVPKRSSVRVKPSNSSTTDVTGMSQTAKRILETLEHFSSPIIDAKKIPVKTPLSTFASRKRAREEDSSSVSTTSVTPIGLRHLTRELTVPTVPDMLKLKRRQRLTNTTLAARKIVSAHSEPAPQVKPAEYHLRTESEDKKFMGKLRAKAKKKVDIEEPAETVNLVHIPLPITTLPSFDIPIPESRNNSNSNTANNNNINKPGTTELESKRISPSKETEPFKFSSPIKFAGANTSLESDGQFTFSQPMKPSQESSTTKNSPVTLNFTAKPNFNFNANSTASSQLSTNFMWSGSSTAPRPKEKKVSETKPAATELQVAGSVMDILGKTADKSEVQIWECRECFIKNNDSDDQCVACKARKSDSKTSLSSSSLPSVDVGPEEKTQQFGTQFKLNDKWECECCLVRNPVTESKCLSCMAQKQDKSKSTSASKSFSNFKSKVEVPKAEAKDKITTKPVDGTWECPGCMLKNRSSVITCPCCNASKPGLVKSVKNNNSEPVFNIQQKTGQTWECPTCMVRNNLTASECVCCMTPCPNKSSAETKSSTQPSTPLPSITSGFGDKFKKPPGAWTCDCCMVQNKADVIECVSCSTLKPGATKKEEKKTDVPTFTFGIPPSAQSLAKSDEKKSDSATNGFTFATPTSQPFTFGIPATSTSTETSEPAGFKFSAPTTTITPKPAETPSPVSGFTFGVPKTVEKVADKVEEKPMFSFGTPKAVEKEKPIVFSNPLTVEKSQEKTADKPVTFSFVPPGSVASTGNNIGASSAAFTFSEPKTSSTPSEPIKFGQSQPASVPVPATTASGFSFTSTKFAESTGPPEKKAAISFGSTTTTPVFGLSSAAASKPEEKSSPFEIADKSKTPFTLEKKPAGFGEEKTPASFGSDKPIFNTGSTTSAFGSVPTTSTPSLFGSTPTPSIFGTGTSSFANASATSIFSAVKPAETPAPAASNQGLFSFGATSTQNTQNSTGGFNFSGANNTTQKPMFSFGSNSVAPTPTPAPTPAPTETGFGTNFGSSASTQPPAFSFNAPKADPPAFGQPSATPLPSIFNNQASGSLGQTPGSNSMFNFGSAAPATGSSTASASTGFSFNTGVTTPATPSGGFNFNATTPSPAIAFDPNTRPTFNFTGGSAVAQFSATPQQAVTQRKIKRAVRRVHPRT